MEVLQRLTRRQLDTLRTISAHETPERGVPLKAVASALGLAAPSALGHITPLEALGLIERYRGKSRLTRKGEVCLDEYTRHHRIAESLFHRTGLSMQESCRAAREVDLALSHAAVERLCQAEGHPTACPHGAPIAPCEATRA